MPDIGSTLRETRMRKRIDIVEVESQTKIRAKYLRALENEEWDLLPGPTFVKTFLRTYGDYLGLDSRMLVEEYKQRFERPTPQDLLPFSPRKAGRRRRGWGVPPFAVVSVIVVLLLAALYALGQLGDSSGDESSLEATPTPSVSPASSSSAKKKSSSKKTPAAASRPTRVRLRIVPTGTVNVCLVSGVSGKVLIDSVNLDAGNTTRLFSAKRLKVTFGNGNARMRIGKRTYQVAQTANGVGYDLRPGRKPVELSATERPDCVS